MLKIPFIEHTGVGIEITSEEIRWVEVDRLGKRLKLRSKGELVHNNGEVSFKGAVEHLIEEIQADAFQIGISIPEALVEVIVEEIPYSEELEEEERWITNQEKELFDKYESRKVLIQYHVIQLDEDNKRCVFQILDSDLIDRYTQILSGLEIYPQYVGSGLLESGYSQIYNTDFVESISSVLHQVGNNTYLTIFENGLVKNIVELSDSQNAELSYQLSESDSYLQTEEASTDQPINSIPILLTDWSERLSAKQSSTEREILHAHPFSGKKGIEELSVNYMTVTGTVIKLFFKGIDSFNFTSAANIDSGIIHHDKKETIRLSILLFVPLIFFGLLTYAFGKVIDHQLVESNQIMNQIGDKIEEVTEKRARLIEVRDRFLEARSMLENQHSIAYVFEEIGITVPKEIWLVRLAAQKQNEETVKVFISGYSRNENSISSFLSSLEQSEYITSANLIVSEKIEASPINRSQPNEGIIGATRFELEVYLVKDE